MAAPKYKQSKSKSRKRVAQWESMEEPSLSTCNNCGSAGHPHKICMGCGYYDGEKVLNISDSSA
jgi:large subunit ribosomal protein L32